MIPLTRTGHCYRRPRVKVLVVVHPDGYLQAFGDPDTDVRFACLHAVHPQAEELAEELMELRLPLCYRRLYFPGYSRGTCLPEHLTPGEERQRAAQRAFRMRWLWLRGRLFRAMWRGTLRRVRESLSARPRPALLDEVLR